jgi:hypothetical protein
MATLLSRRPGKVGEKTEHAVVQGGFAVKCVGVSDSAREVACLNAAGPIPQKGKQIVAAVV